MKLLWDIIFWNLGLVALMGPGLILLVAGPDWAYPYVDRLMITLTIVWVVGIIVLTARYIWFLLVSGFSQDS